MTPDALSTHQRCPWFGVVKVVSCLGNLESLNRASVLLLLGGGGVAAAIPNNPSKRWVPPPLYILAMIFSQLFTPTVRLHYFLCFFTIYKQVSRPTLPHLIYHRSTMEMHWVRQASGKLTMAQSFSAIGHCKHKFWRKFCFPFWGKKLSKKSTSFLASCPHLPTPSPIVS